MKTIKSITKKLSSFVKEYFLSLAGVVTIVTVVVVANSSSLKGSIVGGCVGVVLIICIYELVGMDDERGSNGW